MRAYSQKILNIDYFSTYTECISVNLNYSSSINVYGKCLKFFHVFLRNLEQHVMLFA